MNIFMILLLFFVKKLTIHYLFIHRKTYHTVEVHDKFTIYIKNLFLQQNGKPMLYMKLACSNIDTNSDVQAKVYAGA
jgi:hypothetical protein